MRISIFVLAAGSLLGGSSAFAPPLGARDTFQRSRKILMVPSTRSLHHNQKTPTSSWTAAPTNPSSSVLSAIPESVVLGGTASSSSSTMSPIMAYFLETLIANGVPALFTILVIGFGAFVFGKSRKGGDSDDILKTDNPAAALYDDLYGDSDQGKKRFRLFGGGGDDFEGPGGGGRKKLPKNSGIPKEQFLTVTHLNSKMDSYDYSLAAATQSKAAAAASYRKATFSRALEKALGPMVDQLPARKLQALQEAEAKFLKMGRAVVSGMQLAQTKLMQKAIDEELRKMGVSNPYSLVDPLEISSSSTDHVNGTETANETATTNTTITVETNSTTTNGEANETTTSSDVEMSRKMKRVRSTLPAFQNSDLVLSMQELEIRFVRDVIKAVGPERAPLVRAALLGDVAARGTGGLLLMMLEERPLTALLSSSSNNSVTLNGEPAFSDELVNKAVPRPRVFMTRFSGDVSASQVAELREEVTAIIRTAKPGDEALLVLKTGGGTVTGYGLAAAQLMRFKEAGMKLTICVEQVAASGGYMMACVADRIVASPFAVLGSIGVISDIPNVYDRLKKEGIEFQTVTAGKYKRTLTPTKKVTKEDFDKTKEDVEEILVLFRDYVAQNRPQLDIDKVATGETWFGTAALERGLCDEIKTVDGVIMDYINSNQDVYEVTYTPPLKSAFPGLVSASSEELHEGGLLRRGIRWVVRTLFQEVKAAVAAESSSLNQAVQERYRAEDDTSDRMRAQD